MTARDRALMFQPAALSRIEAARYCGVSPSTFDQLLEAGVMPAPRVVPAVRRKLWLRVELDAALEDMPVAGEEGLNSCDRAFGLSA